jgi:hypothetical protein
MTAPFPMRAFLAGELRADGFGHRAHLQAAHSLLRDHSFTEAADAYVRAIRAMATRAGHPEKFHMTITVAMLSAVAERLSDDGANFDAFAAQHAELLASSFLLRHYSKERLNCDLARRTFLLPDRA